MKFLRYLLCISLLLLLHTPAQANGVLRNGTGARAMGFGGATLIFSGDPLSAINYNPASLDQWRHNELQLSLTAGILNGEYDNSVSTGNNADSTPGLIPEGAYVHALNGKMVIGVSISPVSALEADWEFTDPPGAAGSYGRQTHKSSFLALRTALGAGFKINPDFSLGASVGLIYNRNRLQAPYIFQSHPLLAGAKVLSDLSTDGFGFNGILSANYRVADTMEFSLAYTSPTWFDTDGKITGTTDPVIGIGRFRYDAEVETALPQIVSAGVTWQTTPSLQLGIQLDWIDWSSAFDDLPLHLTHGTNAALNGLLGTNRIDDTAPLDWQDQWVIRFAGNYHYSDKVQLRAGYSYGDSPVPSETLTPMTAAITQHTIGLGLGFKTGDKIIDFSYQWDLPAEDGVGTGRLLFNEYNHSEVNTSIHWLSIAISLNPFH